MKLGIMSDSHGRVELVRRATSALKEAGAEALVHCGDIGDAEVLEELNWLPCWFVWGNSDYPEPSWRPLVESLGMQWPDGPVELTLCGKKIAVLHGHEADFRRILKTAEYDYLFYGHTHQHDDQWVNGMRVINPGALHRTSRPTVALLDLETDELKFIDLD